MHEVISLLCFTAAIVWLVVAANYRRAYRFTQDREYAIHGGICVLNSIVLSVLAVAMLL